MKSFLLNLAILLCFSTSFTCVFANPDLTDKNQEALQVRNLEMERSNNFWVYLINTRKTNRFDTYLPLTGGTVTGKLTVEGGFNLSGGNWNTSYTPDGLWGATATPNILHNTSYYGGLVLGYQDNGSGLYGAAYGFNVHHLDGLGRDATYNAIIMRDSNNGSTPFTVTNKGKLTVGGGFNLWGGSAYTTYTPDGLWGSTATPNVLHTTGGNGGLFLGYQDNGSGLYGAAYGFNVDHLDGLGHDATYNAIVMRDADDGSIPFIVTNKGTVTGVKFIGTSAQFNGSVGIGGNNVDPGSKLTVAGKIHSREVKVTIDAGADFVFQKDYSLKPLAEVAQYISENKHLPEIASADEMKKNGLELGEMNIKLLQKIEELTLHMIDFNKKMEVISSENQTLKEKVARLEAKK